MNDIMIIIYTFQQVEDGQVTMIFHQNENQNMGKSDQNENQNMGKSDCWSEECLEYFFNNKIWLPDFVS